MRNITKIKQNVIYDIFGIFSFGQIVPKNKEKLSSKINIALNYCHDRKPCNAVHKGKEHFKWASEESSIKTVLYSKMTLSVTYRIHKFSHDNKKIRHYKTIRDNRTNKEKEIPIYQWLWDSNCSTCRKANNGLNLLENKYQILLKNRAYLTPIYGAKKKNYLGFKRLTKAEINHLANTHNEIYKDIEPPSKEELEQSGKDRLKVIQRGNLTSKAGLTIHTDKIKKY